MIKVVAVSDKVDTAIDRLCKGVAPYHSNLDYTVCDVHPKKPDELQLQRFEDAARTADIIDFQYFRTAQMLLERYDWLKDKKLILTHNNAYSWSEDTWDWAFANCAANKTIEGQLKKQGSPNVHHIPLATDPTFWEFNQEWQPNKRVIMVANRIESKKGILQVAIACADLGLTFVLVGAISDMGYMQAIMATGNVEFYEQIPDEKLKELYYNSTIHVCNSVDNFESGTLPILEAMQCGVPVLTRPVGHVIDFKDGKNVTILDGEPDDVEGIKKKLTNMLNDKKGLEEQRQAGWNTAKGYNMERRAYEYQRLYRSTVEGEAVSVIVPVYDKPETIRACLNAIAEQTYKNIEIIAVDDLGKNESLIADIAKTMSIPVRYINNAQGDYGLARARNRGIIEATGDILVFCDQRMIMLPDAIDTFVKNLVPKTWLFGHKGADKDTFVENFSCVSRTEIIEAGMFNERIDRYGGMSQEIRARTRQQGFIHQYIPQAKCIAMGKSSNKNRKKADILAMKNLLWKVGL